MMTEDTFQKWMQSELTQIRREVATIRTISEQNTETLRGYMWFGKGVKFVLMLAIGVVTLNWQQILKAMGKG